MFLYTTLSLSETCVFNCAYSPLPQCASTRSTTATRNSSAASATSGKSCPLVAQTQSHTPWSVFVSSARDTRNSNVLRSREKRPRRWSPQLLRIAWMVPSSM